MNRKDFFKKLGAGAIVAAIAPKMLVKEEEPTLTWSEPIVTDFTDKLIIKDSPHGEYYTEEVTTTI